MVIYHQLGTNPISDSDRFGFHGIWIVFFPGTFAANVRNLDHSNASWFWVHLSHAFFERIFRVSRDMIRIGSWCVIPPSQLFCNELMPISYLPKPPKINGNCRILKWRYVSTICLAIFCGDIHLHRPYIGLIYGRYLHFRILKISH